MKTTIVKIVKLFNLNERNIVNRDNFIPLIEKFSSDNFYIIDANKKLLNSTIISEMLINPKNLVLINISERSKTILDILGASNILTIRNDLHQAYLYVKDNIENFEVDYDNQYMLYIS